MEDLNKILQGLEVPTSDLKLGELQFLLLKVKKINEQSNDGTGSLELYSKIVQKLWTHLQTGLNKYDDQLLCSTCFYTILSMLEKDNAILHVMIQNITEELNKNEDKERKLSITYGMFQSNFLTQKDCQYGCILNDLLNSMISLLIEMAYVHSHHRAIVFKVLISLKKALGTNFQDIVFAKHNQLKLLNLVNQNWENSMKGTIKLNRTILQTVISTMDDDMQKDFLEEINDFYWNKAKYLTFSEVIEQYKGNLKIFIKTYNLVEGLLYSLSRPGLVSAGADMYCSILKNMKTDNEWADIFLDKITKLLCCSSQTAKENFNNYWCLKTFRQFPFVGLMIINSLQKYEDMEQGLLSILNVMKQCNKLNLFEKNWTQSTQIEKNILCGIEHNNPYIRMAAFEIVCVTHGKSWPSEMEYEIILKFLSDNVNSDFKVLRLTMVNSLRSFLRRLQSLHVNHANKEDKDNENLLSFCAKLQEFIFFSLNLNGNYQRRITTINVASTLINCFTEYPKTISKKIKRIDYLLYFLCDNKCWTLFNINFIEKLINLLCDPADDIRDTVSQLLLCNYNYQMKQPIIMDEVVDIALLKIKSKFFYEINCGESMFKLLAYVVLKEVCRDAAMFRNIEEIFNFAYTKLLSEYNSKRDIVESIDNGEQLHSYIRILYVTFDACHTYSYKLNISGDSILSLLEILDGVSNQFVWEEGVPTSSDFSKMDDMVRQIIENSGYTSKNEDGAKITGLEQIVLNCLWLNVKASCELAAALIKYCTIDTSLDVCEKSLFVITKVLETCRHKGAIEAAGVALGEAIHCITYLPEENQLTNLPLTLLKQKLNDLISGASNMASVTRRGAGLSIMLHRIVTNDMGSGKPLFNYFINTVLETCKTVHDDLNDTANNSNEKDIPKAVYIHVLTRIVRDSSLLTDIMHYSAELAEIAFHNLTSPHWQIRNAALQLYGALIPKLIGQKKLSGLEHKVTATIAYDEFRTHLPNLWTFILEQLNERDDKDILQSHANLLPILNILGNMAKRYNLSNDLQAQREADNKLLSNLSVLLGSPIYAVRRLTAKSIINIYSINDIYEILIKTEEPTENYLHGCLLLLAYCYKYYENVKYQNELELLKKHFCSIIQGRQCSYLCKGLIEYVTDKVYNVTELEEILIPMGLNEPGQYEWIYTQIGKCLLYCSSSELPKCVELILNCSEYEKYCKILYSRLFLNIDTDYDVLREITNILLLFPKRMQSTVVWEILYKISCSINIDVNEDINNIIDYVRNESICYKLRFMIPFIARISIKEDDILVICKVIHKLCIAKDFDVDMRKISAIANNEIALKLNNYPDEIKIISITTAIILLQDEDDNVRYSSIFFYKNLKNMNTTTHPFICLRSILNLEFLKSILNDSKTGIESICQIITELLSPVDTDIDEFNPFANESKNIYLEVEWLKNVIKELKE